MTEWYYARGEQRVGPITESELRQLVSTGTIQPDDLVWGAEMSDWRPASEKPWEKTESVPQSASQPQLSRLAIAAFVCALLGIIPVCPVFPLAAIVTGHIALSQTRWYGHQYRGRGLTVAALIMGYLSLAVWVGLFYLSLYG